MTAGGALGAVWADVVVEWEPADLAMTCLASRRVAWTPHEAEFLGFVAGVRPTWRHLSQRQVGWFEALCSRVVS